MKTTIAILALLKLCAFSQQCTCVIPQQSSSKGKSLGILKSYKYPKDGTKLRVKFLDGTTKQHNEAWKHFSYIDSICGITLIRVPIESDAEIRVSFSQHEGHWSYLGKSSQTIPQDKKTMNLQLTTGVFGDSKEDWRRVCYHELLHAFGFVHEHSSANANKIVWNKERVYRYYQATQGWSKAQVDTQVLFRYSIGSTNSTLWDGKSIMQYPIEPGLANISIPWNTKLSEMDISFLQETYGK
jgi:serralysin